jgi:1,2-diacylglycerol 3-alpha-glucosyltransferase
VRIGLAVDTYKPYVSGVTNYVSLLKSELEKRGHVPVVYAFGRPDDPLGEENVIVSPGFRLKMGYAFGWRYSKEARQSLLEMDVVHLHHPFITGQVILRMVKGRVPLFFTAHTRYDYFSQDYLPWLPTRISQSFLRSYMPVFCSKMARVICNSPASVEALRNCGVHGPLEVIPNGVDQLPFRTAVRNPALRAEMGGWPVQWITTGRLAKEKNLPFLLDAFAILIKHCPEVGLAIVGGGPEENDLRMRVSRLNLKDRVRFFGAVSYSRLPEFLATADFFVMVSLKDTHPLTVIEALAAGLPAVVVDSPAYAGTVIHGLNGLVTRPDPVSLADAMEFLTAQPNIGEEMARAAPKSVEEFTIQRVADRILHLYSSVIGEYPGMGMSQ